MRPRKPNVSRAVSPLEVRYHGPLPMVQRQDPQFSASGSGLLNKPVPLILQLSMTAGARLSWMA